jgi:integrase
MSTSNADEAPDDPVEYFLEDLTYQGKTERTREAYGRVLRRFEGFLADPERNATGEPLAPDEASHRDCMAWVHGLRDEVGDSTVASYAAYLHRFYAYMTQVGVFEANPMTLVVEEMDETVDKDPSRREISIREMRRFVSGITHPLDRALVVTLLKTGMRVGECCNLDLRDIALDDAEIEAARPASPRPQVDGRPNSVYVDSAPARGERHNGEEREASNKRKRDTVIPVDQELGAELKRWLAIRPDSPSPAEPLFVYTAGDWGQRLTPRAVRNVVTDHARAAGWYESGGSAADNVTPHYFRHFFTTHLRDRTGDRGVVKYLRGDVADDIIDTYTHNWGGQVRATYEENIYSILG